MTRIHPLDKALADALEFAIDNLEQIALPHLEAAGVVSSVPNAIRKGKRALKLYYEREG